MKDQVSISDQSADAPRLSSSAGTPSITDEDNIGEIDVEDADAGILRLASVSAASEGGGLAVCASGPESLVREAANAGARMQMPGRGGRSTLRMLGLHMEVFMV